MTTLVVAGLSFALGAFRLGELSFELDSGEILVVLGPNGAGKSVLLESIAGFHRPARGTITIGGREVTRLPPERRRVGFLVQNFGLFPHLTVAQNVALGAHARGAENGQDVAGLLARFGIAGLAEANPLTLSPGEKQRAALARALASRPDLFLLDEPFSALDVMARDELRHELGRFLGETRIPALFVTHDHADAAALGDRVAVMDQGRILQQSGVGEIFRRPASARIAEILGVENLLQGRIEGREGGALRVALGGAILRAAAAGAPGAGEAWIAIRAEAVHLAKLETPSGAARNRLEGQVIAVQSWGALSKVTLDCGFRLASYVMTRDLAGLGLAPGARATAGIEASDIHVFARESAPG
jgi:molybdate/tungstate transport system ATP-binding protein